MPPSRFFERLSELSVRRINLFLPIFGEVRLPLSDPVHSFIFLLLVTNVLADHRFVPTYGRHEATASPEMLPYEVPFPLSVDLRHMDRALPFDVPHHLTYYYATLSKRAYSCDILSPVRLDSYPLIFVTAFWPMAMKS